MVYIKNFKLGGCRAFFLVQKNKNNVIIGNGDSMKIFLTAGTEDGRKLAEFLSSHGHNVTASVTTDYGKKILSSHEGINISDKKLKTMI